ncbi:hypothetical protein PSM7751_03726 [Pseudooceanicola marinus]|uniref:Uncharacterized protein n=1 Tax=Pseudooceanicola marinus TaxID=396013 RepID=A0A1X7A4H6_9RHOB|nr:hypothetical protein [Pseudooceanicola marinus]PJE27160.1 hypothetical protein CVM50_17245 [Pseudooceanicola marinus]SLN70405.1 hypothetical protein PSM7751_03726 [Pseudooceanicola marinus]
MSLPEKVSGEAAASAVSWAVATAGAASLWIVRTVLTNHRKIALLEQAVGSIAKSAEEDRAARVRLEAKLDGAIERGLGRS